MTRICFLDTETTGLQPHHHEVWEIAVISRALPGDGDDVELMWHVRPDLTKADPTALRIGRFYERTAPLDAWTPARPVPAGTARTPPLTRSPVSSTARTSSRPTRRSTWRSCSASCTATARPRPGTTTSSTSGPSRSATSTARGAFGAGPAPMPWSTERLAELVGVPAQAAGSKHTALGDARWVRNLYDEVTRPPSTPTQGPPAAAPRQERPVPGPPPHPAGPPGLAYPAARP